MTPSPDLYQASEITGTEYLRARMVQIHNQIGVPPHVAFLEERVTQLAGRTITQDNATLTTPYNPDAVIDLLNPADKQPLGETMTHGQIMVGLYSLYMALATQRDREVGDGGL